MRFVLIKAMAVAACLAGAAAALLVLTRPAAPAPDITVFGPEQVTRLTNDNVVDLLIGEPIGAAIERADWTGSALAVDLAVGAASGTPDAVFHDLKRLIRLAFDRTPNVDRLLVRFVEADSSEGGRLVLLLAADVRRSDNWLAEERDRLGDADLTRDAVWRQRLRLTHTPRWTERFGPFASVAERPPRS